MLCLTLMRVTHYRHLSPIFVGDTCRRQKSVVWHTKITDFCRRHLSPTNVVKIKRVWFSRHLSCEIELCDWSAALFTIDINMETNWSDEDIYKLIQLYEVNPLLFDPKNTDYRNRELRRMKEIEVAEELNRSGTKCQTLRRKGHSGPPLFGPCLLLSNGRPSQQVLNSCFKLGSAPNFGVAGANFSKIFRQAQEPHPVAVKSCNLEPRCLVQMI